MNDDVIDYEATSQYFLMFNLFYTGEFLLPSSFFVINPFRKKTFILNELDFESKLILNNSWKFEIATVTESFSIFEVFRSHFPKSEHFLSNT